MFESPKTGREPKKEKKKKKKRKQVIKTRELSLGSISSSLFRH